MVATVTFLGGGFRLTVDNVLPPLISSEFALSDGAWMSWSTGRDAWKVQTMFRAGWQNVSMVQ